MGEAVNGPRTFPNHIYHDQLNNNQGGNHIGREIVRSCDPTVLDTLALTMTKSNGTRSHYSLRNGLVAPKWHKTMGCCAFIISSVLYSLKRFGSYITKKVSWPLMFITLMMSIFMFTLFTDFIPFNRIVYSKDADNSAKGFIPLKGNTQSDRSALHLRRDVYGSDPKITLPLPRASTSSFNALSANGSQQGKAIKRFPACIVFGVSKCGTKAVIEYLKLHPHVVAPRSEINFFNNETLQHQHGLDWYIQQMPPSLDHQITVEKSPDYFQNHLCADLIRAAAPATKLILLLREPIERLVSEYMQLSEKRPGLPEFDKWVIGQDTGDVDQRVPSVMVSAYSEHVSYWLSVFPREQIHIIESQSLRDYPLQEMRRVEKFLNLQPFFQPDDFYYNSTRGFYCMRMRFSGKTQCLGKSKGREHITVSQSIMEKLQNFYQPYNNKLKQILSLDFPWL
ncbi:sulfotransferase [Elysia marginata]|uniref:Sulfotransferase n=1 Tax=Elysia marginata TaxID=1093978 RepID=A0AAV4JXW0_9GAST|nr:sulfotransferase [Elysia marginata]